MRSAPWQAAHLSLYSEAPAPDVVAGGVVAGVVVGGVVAGVVVGVVVGAVVVTIGGLEVVVVAGVPPHALKPMVAMIASAMVTHKRADL